MSTLSPRVRLLGLFDVRFRLAAETGLLIRSGKGKEILGGADIQPVAVERVYRVREGGREVELVVTVPYIPGSSLKGRARALLELALGLDLHTTDGKIYQHMRTVQNSLIDEDPYCPVDNVFGSASIPPSEVTRSREFETPEEYARRLRRITFVEKCWAPTRVVFRDLYPSADYVERLYEERGASLAFEDFLEEKWENRIDRVTSAADPRNVLRVRPGVEFEGSLTFLVFDLDVCRRRECDELSRFKLEYPARDYLRHLLDALALVEETYLGASGTRGYGKVRFQFHGAEFVDAAKGERVEVASKPMGLAEFRKAVLEHEVWGRLRGLCATS